MEDDEVIQELDSDKNIINQYVKGKFLGKGGFAKCFELNCIRNGKIFAGKVVVKESLKKTNAKQKLRSEIKIHRGISHMRIVKFCHVFEDTKNVYILLEVCKNHTLSELLKRRKKLSEVETRYYMFQILEGVKYLHSVNVIHRDLKLGNLFLTEDMQIKIGDFGLATLLEKSGQRRKTMCGTPNYIAPEILSGGSGHSFEVDIWSIGVILYTMLVGRPPFETTDVKLTYKRIKANLYSYPSNAQVSVHAKSLIDSILQINPNKRPTIGQIMIHPFFTCGGQKLPATLPTSSLTTNPFPEKNSSNSVPVLAKRYPLRNRDLNVQAVSGLEGKTGAAKTKNRYALDAGQVQDGATGMKASKTESPSKHLLEATYKTLTKCLAPESATSDKESELVNGMQAIALSKETLPPNRIVQWVDYTSKYGMGYLYSDGSCGVYFNDATKMILLPNHLDLYFIDRTSRRGPATPQKYTTTSYDEGLQKKMTLLEHFKKYLLTQQEKEARSSVHNVSPAVTSDIHVCPLYVRKWIKSKHAVLFCYTDGCIQVNFFDNTRLILYDAGSKVSYSDKQGLHIAMTSAEASLPGSNNDIYKRLKYANDILYQMIINR